MDNLIKIKADIICHGLLTTKVSEEIYKYQNPNEMHKQGRYFGIMIKLEDKISLLANVSYDNKNSNYKLEGTLKDLELRDKKIILFVKLVLLIPQNGMKNLQKLIENFLKFLLMKGKTICT